MYRPIFGSIIHGITSVEHGTDDDAFTDTADVEWCFFQKERELKTRLYNDYFGKAQVLFLVNHKCCFGMLQVLFV